MDNFELYRKILFIYFIGLLFGVFVLIISSGENTLKDSGVIVSKESINYCGVSYSSACLCRDTCSNRLGYSDYYNWLYKRNGECWCINHYNESSRVF